MSVVLLIIGLLLFVGLVVAHEFGHFLAARRNGVDVEEFGVGFPPRAWSKKTKNGFLFSLNWLPIGGFVKLKGEHDSDTEKGSFGAARLSTKVKIMLAGVGMNLLAAFVILTVLAAVGMPQLLDNQFSIKSDAHTAKQEVLVGYIEKDSPAARAGLHVRDQLISFTSSTGQTLKASTATTLPAITQGMAGQNIQLTYIRNGVTRQARVQLLSERVVDASKKTSNPKGYLGISPTEYKLTRATWSAPVVAIGTMWQFTTATFHGLGTAINALFHGQGSKASQQVSGPIGIVVLLKDGSLLGYQFMLMIIAIISLTLAIMNVLPIPALDGGRLFVTLISRLFKMPLTQAVEERIYGAGFAVLMLLVVVITIVDVKRYF
ncbi:MAG: M50 family metallopeptidase [Candidatus Saccharibacteria bacterium]